MFKEYICLQPLEQFCTKIQSYYPHIADKALSLIENGLPSELMKEVRHK